jgi:hypothetical protein
MSDSEGSKEKAELAETVRIPQFPGSFWIWQPVWRGAVLLGIAPAKESGAMLKANTSEANSGNWPIVRNEV